MTGHRMVRWVSTAAAGTTMLLALVGCTSSQGFKAGYGQKAVDVAHHVPACTNVKRVPTEDPSYDSEARCKIDGIGVYFSVLARAPRGMADNLTNDMYSSKFVGVIALGDGWSADVGTPGKILEGLNPRRQVAAKVADALGGEVKVIR